MLNVKFKVEGSTAQAVELNSDSPEGKKLLELLGSRSHLVEPILLKVNPDDGSMHLLMAIREP